MGVPPKQGPDAMLRHNLAGSGVLVLRPFDAGAVW